MMLPTGNLFHIDFGYIFGRDPKPMAPPIRFTREMAEAMGGVNSEDYRLFKTYCCQVMVSKGTVWDRASTEDETVDSFNPYTRFLVLY